MKSKLSLRDFTSAQARREFLEKELGITLSSIASFAFMEESVAGRNIENLIGATQIPLGVAGPIMNHFIPLATTEGALVASVSRGCKAIMESGGACVEVELVGTTRGPVFATSGLQHGFKVKNWIEKNFSLIAQTTQKTSSHLKLLKIDAQILGKNLFLRFYYDTGDAMGMNMVTIATDAAVKLIEQKTKAKCIALAGNFDIDKKPAYLNFILGRGKKVWAEAVLPKKIVREVLKTTPEKIAEVVEKNVILVL